MKFVYDKDVDKEVTAVEEIFNDYPACTYEEFLPHWHKAYFENGRPNRDFVFRLVRHSKISFVSPGTGSYWSTEVENVWECSQKGSFQLQKT